jgi:hypothetical protein
MVNTAVLALIDNGEWMELVSLLSDGRPLQKPWPKFMVKKIREIVESSECVLRVAIPALARSEKLANADSKSQLRISEFLDSRLSGKSSSAWRKRLPMDVAGAAIERAGRDLDALRFYEQWRDNTSSAKERAYAQMRWVVCKLRQADREEREGRAIKAANYREDAHAAMEKEGWAGQKVPTEYPDLSSHSTLQGEIAARSARTGDHSGRFEFINYRVLMSKGWVNLESDDGLRARVHIGERRVSSDDFVIEEKSDGQKYCTAWGLSVRWNGHDAIQLVVGDKSCDLALTGGSE